MWVLLFKIFAGITLLGGVYVGIYNLFRLSSGDAFALAYVAAYCLVFGGLITVGIAIRLYLIPYFRRRGRNSQRLG